MPGEQWSFARADQSGKVIEVAEKKRISNNVSTGLYYFSSGYEFLNTADEIIKSKIDKSILNKNLTSNIVLTGNSSQLKGICDLASSFFGTKVRLGKPIDIKGLAENTSGPGFSVSVGLIKYKMLKIQGENLNKLNEGSLIENSLIWRKFGTWIKESFC